MSYIKTGFATLLPLSLACVALSANASTWNGEAELGAVVTTGNTETQTLNAKGKLVNDRKKWKHVGMVEALSTSDDVRTTSERYLLSAKSDYKYDEVSYAFVRINYEKDRFSGYDYQVSETLGYGRKIITEPNLTLALEAGPGARQSKLDMGDSDDEFIVRLAGDLVWKISENAEFSEDLSTEVGEDVTISKSVSALKAQIVGSLAMKLSYTVKHTSDVPVETEKTDTETALTLVYSF